MTKETATKINNKPKKLEFELGCGKKLTIDLSKATENVIFNCRLAGQEKVVIYIMSEIGLFDGEKIPAPELLSMLDMFDVMELEGIWSALEKKYVRRHEIPNS